MFGIRAKRRSAPFMDCIDARGEVSTPALPLESGAPLSREDPDLTAAGRGQPFKTPELSPSSAGERKARLLPKRIGLFGNFGIGSFGNDASLEAMILFLRQARPDAEIVCICPKPAAVREAFKVATLPVSAEGPLLWRKTAVWIYALKTLRAFDVLIIPGTGILTDFAIGASGMPFDLFVWCLAAKIWRVPVLFVNIGAGPIQNPLSRWLLKSAATRARYRSYRDAVSRDFMIHLGVAAENDAIFPDNAFSLLSPSCESGSSAAGDITVGVGVMAYCGWTNAVPEIYREYFGKITKFVHWLLDQNFRVRILMGDAVDRQPLDDIKKLILSKRLDLKEKQFVAEPARSAEDVLAQMAETNLVVASRFHHLVFALKLAKPCISLGYDRKHDELMISFGMGEFCQHAETFSNALLIEHIQKLAVRRSDYAASIAAEVESKRKELSQQRSALLTQFLE